MDQNGKIDRSDEIQTEIDLHFVDADFVENDFPDYVKTENKFIENPKIPKKPKNAIRSKKIEKLKKTKENN